AAAVGTPAAAGDTPGADTPAACRPAAGTPAAGTAAAGTAAAGRSAAGTPAACRSAWPSAVALVAAATDVAIRLAGAAVALAVVATAVAIPPAAAVVAAVAAPTATAVAASRSSRCLPVFSAASCYRPGLATPGGTRRVHTTPSSPQRNAPSFASWLHMIADAGQSCVREHEGRLRASKHCR